MPTESQIRANRENAAPRTPEGKARSAKNTACSPPREAPLHNRRCPPPRKATRPSKPSTKARCPEREDPTPKTASRLSLPLFSPHHNPLSTMLVSASTAGPYANRR